jgi:hypothetical protein
VKSDLQAGLVVGFLVAAAVATWALLLPRPRRPAPVAGVAVVAGALIALSGRFSVPAHVVVAIVGIGAICAVPRRVLPSFLAVALTVPFALFLVSGIGGLPEWVRGLGALAASAGAVASARTDASWRACAVTPALLALTAVAILVAVPDTEEAAVFAGAALPVAVLGWPFGLASLGGTGAGAVTALAVWVAATGGRAVPAALVGALGCLGLLVGLSAGRALRRGDVRRVPAAIEDDRLPVFVIGAHAVLVAVASRIGAAHAGTGRAVIVALVVIGASVAVGARVPPPSVAPSFWPRRAPGRDWES